jgi:hypothetical protein
MDSETEAMVELEAADDSIEPGAELGDAKKSIDPICVP